MNIRKFLFTFIPLSLTFVLVTGCYRMPQEGDYSVIPATNNPSVVGTHGADNLLPPGGF